MLRWLRRTPESFVRGEGADDEERRLPDVSAGRILRFDTRAVFAALDKRRTERGITWQQVASEIGGGAQAASLTRMAHGGRTGFPAIARIARWLGCPIARLTHATEL
jgi:hypothetical protein